MIMFSGAITPLDFAIRLIRKFRSIVANQQPISFHDPSVSKTPSQSSLLATVSVNDLQDLWLPKRVARAGFGRRSKPV
jgi:hypothetical protein